MTSNFTEHSCQFPLTYTPYAVLHIQFSSMTLLAPHTMHSPAGSLPLLWYSDPLLSSLTHLHTRSNHSQVATQPHCHNVTLITTNYTTAATFPHMLLPSVCKTDYSQMWENDSKSWYCHVTGTAEAGTDYPHLQIIPNSFRVPQGSSLHDLVLVWTSCVLLHLCSSSLMPEYLR
jgi:hypothetical protein